MNLTVIHKSIPLADDVSAELEIDYDGTDELDTVVKIDGGWCVAGAQYPEFCEKLSKLIEEYRI